MIFLRSQRPIFTREPVLLLKDCERSTRRWKVWDEIEVSHVNYMRSNDFWCLYWKGLQKAARRQWKGLMMRSDLKKDVQMSEPWQNRRLMMLNENWLTLARTWIKDLFSKLPHINEYRCPYSNNDLRWRIANTIIIIDGFLMTYGYKNWE